MLENTDEIRMSHTLFVDDAMVFDNMESKTALLIGKNGRGVKIEFQDFDNILVWSSANGGPFVALEPGREFQPALMRMKFLKTKGNDGS